MAVRKARKKAGTKGKGKHKARKRPSRKPKRTAKRKRRTGKLVCRIEGPIELVPVEGLCYAARRARKEAGTKGKGKNMVRKKLSKKPRRTAKRKRRTQSGACTKGGPIPVRLTGDSCKRKV